MFKTDDDDPAPRGGTTAGLPAPVAAWDFGGAAPFTDTVNGYRLLHHNRSHPVVVVNATPPFARAAAFGWASHSTWAECGQQPCGNRVYAGRGSVPRLAEISGTDARVTVVAWVWLGGQGRGQRRAARGEQDVDGGRDVSDDDGVAEGEPPKCR